MPTKEAPLPALRKPLGGGCIAAQQVSYLPSKQATHQEIAMPTTLVVLPSEPRFAAKVEILHDWLDAFSRDADRALLDGNMRDHEKYGLAYHVVADAIELMTGSDPRPKV